MRLFEHAIISMVTGHSQGSNKLKLILNRGVFHRTVLCVSQGYPGFPGFRGLKGEKGNLFVMNVKGETCSTVLLQGSEHILN